MTFLVYLQGFTMEKYSDLTPGWTRPETSQTKGKIGRGLCFNKTKHLVRQVCKYWIPLTSTDAFCDKKNCTNIRKTVFHTIFSFIYIVHVKKLYIYIQFIVIESVLRRQVILRGLAQQKHFFQKDSLEKIFSLGNQYHKYFQLYFVK